MVNVPGVALFAGLVISTCIVTFAQQQATVDSPNTDSVAALREQIDALKRKLEQVETRLPVVVCLPLSDAIGRLADKPSERHFKLALELVVDRRDKAEVNRLLIERADSIEVAIKTIVGDTTSSDLRDADQIQLLRLNIQRAVSDKLCHACTVRLVSLQIQ
ncbi:MAG: hypothetical protein AAF456_06690 [Planctomycetota bacterium]